MFKLCRDNEIQLHWPEKYEKSPDVYFSWSTHYEYTHIALAHIFVAWKLGHVVAAVFPRAQLWDTLPVGITTHRLPYKSPTF